MQRYKHKKSHARWKMGRLPGDALGMCYIHIPLLLWTYCIFTIGFVVRIGISVYISAWASTLLVQLYRVMRRPRNVGRATGRFPR